MISHADLLPVAIAPVTPMISAIAGTPATVDAVMIPVGPSPAKCCQDGYNAARTIACLQPVRAGLETCV